MDDKRKGLYLNQGIEGGRYSIVKIFHHPEKVKNLLEGKVSAPIYVRVKPTNRCNDRCFYCLYEFDRSGIHETMSRRDEIPGEKLMEILDDFNEMGVQALTFSGGGEPLVHPNIKEAIKRTLDYGIGLSVITNGHNLNGEIAELMTQAYWVRVSLDYCNGKMFKKIRKRPEEWFNQRIKNIEDFAKAKGKQCDLEVNCVVNEVNYMHLKKIAQMCKDIGVENIRFSPDWTKDYQKNHPWWRRRIASWQIRRAEQLAESNFSVGSSYGRYFTEKARNAGRPYSRCFWMEIVPAIGADQNVYTCHANAYEPEAKIGSIKEQSFKEMWFSKETAEFFSGFNPRKTCAHECPNDEKNKLLNELASCREKKVRIFP